MSGAYPSIPAPDGTPSGSNATLMAMKRVVELLVANTGGSGPASVNAVARLSQNASSQQATQMTLAQQVAALTQQVSALNRKMTFVANAYGINAESVGGALTFKGVTPMGKELARAPIGVESGLTLNGLLIRPGTLSQANSVVNHGSPISMPFGTRKSSKTILLATYKGGEAASDPVTLELSADGVTQASVPVPVVSGNTVPAILAFALNDRQIMSVGARVVGSGTFTGLGLLAVELAR